MPAPQTTDPTAFYAFMTSLLTLVTVIVGGVFKRWDDGRRDAKIKADLIQDNAKVKADLMKEQQQAKRDLLSANSHIGKKIDENTELSATAFKEANNFNSKIAAWERVAPTLPALLDELKRL